MEAYVYQNFLTNKLPRYSAVLVAAFSAFPFLSSHQQKKEYSQEERNQLAERILDTYGRSILRMAYSYLHNYGDAEDILQETLIKYMQCSTTFDSSEHEKAWLLRVSANLSKNRIAYNTLREGDELNETLIKEERTDLSYVWEAVQSLPTGYREVIHLFYHEGYSTSQIADILQEKESTIRSKLHRGRTKLKEILKEDYDFD